MGDKDEATLEQKINLLLEETKKAKTERKKERVLSKIDVVYSVIITLTVFIMGIMVNKFDFLVKPTGLIALLIPFVLTLAYSFLIGFRAMVNDSMDNRVLSWCLLIVSMIWWLVIYFFASVGYLFLFRWASQNWYYGLATYILMGAITALLFYASNTVGKKFTLWCETELGSLLGEKVIVWEKIRNRINKGIFLIMLNQFL